MTSTLAGEPAPIPFNAPPSFPGVEKAIVRAVLGRHTAGGGPYGRRCEEWLGAWATVPALLTTSATHALEMAALLLDVGPGDEVLVPSFTFVSTANAFALRGATLRFVDADERGNLSLDHVESLLSEKTRAAVAMHYGGTSCDMDRLLAFAARRGVAVVEDAAQALGARYRDRPLGSLSALAALSFHETKNVSSGEGGALLVGDRGLLPRAHHLRDKGTDRREFSLGMREKYEWVDLGSSWALSDLNAAYLDAQLSRFDEIAARRRSLWSRYAAALAAPVAAAGGRTLDVPPHNEPNHHLFAIVWPDAETRGRFIRWMDARRISTPFHYVALHRSPFGRRFHVGGEPLPNAEALSEGLARLPLFFNLSDTDQDRVIEATLDFCRGA